MAYKINQNCISCGACELACHVNAISMGEDRYVIDKEKCISCGTCASVCPMGAPEPDDE